MKKFALLVSCIALAACAEAGAPEEEDVAVEETAAVAYAGGAGSYTRTTEDGKAVETIIGEDGSYTSSLDGEQTSAGTVTVDGANICFNEADSEEEPECWVNKPMNEDGSFETTSPDGETYTVTMAATAEEAPAE